MLPLARPAILVVLLFSLVWHWNDYFEPTMFFYRQDFFTLPMRLSILSDLIVRVVQEGGDASSLLTEGLTMAATLLVILPPLLVYIFTQRYFVESIDRTGLVE